MRRVPFTYLPLLTMTKSLLLFVVLMALKVSLYGQSYADSIQTKSDIIKNILRLVNNNRPKSEIATTILVIDSRYRPIKPVTGVSGEWVLFGELVKDSVMTKSISEDSDSAKTIILEKESLNLDRSAIINSTGFLRRKYCTKCTKLYLEIGMPVEGWEILELYELMNDPLLTFQYKDMFLQYQFPLINIPVFVYEEINGMESISQYLYTFKIETKNKQITTKFSKRLKLN